MRASFILFTFALYLSLPAFSRPADGTCTDEAPMSGSPKAQVESLITAAQMAENNDGMKAADAARSKEKLYTSNIESLLRHLNDVEELFTRGDDSGGMLKLVATTRDSLSEEFEKVRKIPDPELRLERLKILHQRTILEVGAIDQNPESMKILEKVYPEKS